MINNVSAMFMVQRYKKNCISVRICNFFLYHKPKPVQEAAAPPPSAPIIAVIAYLTIVKSKRQLLLLLSLITTSPGLHACTVQNFLRSNWV